MIITGMAEYESVCKNALVKWYNSHNETKITLENVFVVWACKTLQNYKALLSTTVSGDGIYAEYTYNGDKQELYEDVYGKLTNQCIKTAELKIPRWQSERKAGGGFFAVCGGDGM